MIAITGRLRRKDEEETDGCSGGCAVTGWPTGNGAVMTYYKEGDKVRVNGDDRVWRVTSPGNRQGCWISLSGDGETHHAAYAWLVKSA